jgi:hypothetical protein
VIEKEQAPYEFKIHYFSRLPPPLEGEKDERFGRAIELQMLHILEQYEAMEVKNI